MLMILAFAGLGEARVAPERRIRPQANPRRPCPAENAGLVESSRPGRQARRDQRRESAGRSRGLRGLMARSVLPGAGHKAHDHAATVCDQFGSAENGHLPAIGVTLDHREATPLWGTSVTGSGPGSRAVPGRRHGLIAGASSTRRCFACLRSIPKCIAEPVERGHGQPVASVIPKNLTHADMEI